MVKGLMASGWQKGCRNAQEIDNLLAFCRDTQVTDLYFHVRMRATTLYPSKYEPPYDFGGLDGNGQKKHPIDFDSLSYALANKGDIKIHAYLTMLEIGKKEHTRFPSEWLMKTAGGTYFFDPTVQEVRDHHVSICKEVVTNYPTLDGIYLEKLRYPQNVIARGNEDKRKTDVLTLIEDICHEIKLINPAIEISYCSNLNKNCPENVIFTELVDWRDLITMGIIDTFCPTLFKSPDNEKEFDEWLTMLDPSHTNVIIGACDLKLEVTEARIEKLESLGFGYIVYSYGYFSSWGEKRVDFKAKLCQAQT
jgi:uncharacterized lipoprotein YddW (UPF0748 family)